MADTTQEPTKGMLGNLGISVYHLQHIFLETKVCGATNNSTGESLSRSSTIHEIENLQGPPGVVRQNSANTISPVDGRKGASYVNCLSGDDHVGEATHMLSYWWGYAIGDIVDSLCDYCKTHNLNTKSTYIWIDCLCINQHRVVEQKRIGGTGMLNFEQEFPVQLKKIGHMLALMAPWQAPVYLTRLWCVFEVYTAHTKGCKVTIIMSTKEKESLEQDVIVKGGGIDKLYEALGNTRVQHANATFGSDRRKILEMIEVSVGYQVLNNQVNALLRRWMSHTLEQMVEAREEADDESYASFCNRIGDILYYNGENDAALEQFHKCLAIRETLFGTENGYTAEAYNNIGSVLESKGNYDAALDQHQKCLAIRETIFGMDHTETAATYNNIGSVMRKKGDLDGALENYQKCLAIQESVFGQGHRSAAPTHNNIGSVLYYKGNYNGALEQHEKCLVIRESVLGENHPDTAITYGWIGSLLEAKDDFDGALEQHYKCHKIQESVLGTDHRDTATTCNNIGWVLFKKNDYDGALEQFLKCLALRESVLGTDHQDTAASHRFIGDALHMKGCYDRALKHYHSCLAIYETMLGKDHLLEMATAHNNIGSMLRRKGDYDGALEQHQKCLAIRESLLGQDHPSTATTYNNIGSVLGKQGDHHASLEYYQTCLVIREASLGANHPLTVDCAANIAAVRQMMGK